MKNDKFNVHVPKWHLTYFLPIDGHFGQIVMYKCTNFDVQTNFEVNQTQIIHSIPINAPQNLGLNFFWRPQSKIGH